MEAPPTDAVAFGPDGALRAATGLDLSATDLIFHGTTVATNVMLNDQLARGVLLVTEAFATCSATVMAPGQGLRSRAVPSFAIRAPSRPVGGSRTTLQPGR